jgi:hypothetical protein
MPVLVTTLCEEAIWTDGKPCARLRTCGRRYIVSHKNGSHSGGQFMPGIGGRTPRFVPGAGGGSEDNCILVAVQDSCLG